MYSWQDLDLNQPLNGAHPLNRGRLAWWLAVPGRYGEPTWWDLVAGLGANFTNTASGFGWNTFSNPGGAGSIKLTGATAYLNAGTAPAIQPSNITVAAWCYSLTSAAGPGAIATRNQSASGGTEGWRLDRSSSNLRFTVSNGTTAATATKTGGLTVNTWFHLAGTYDGTTVRLYLNGAQAATASLSGTLYNSASTNLEIGQGVGITGIWNGYLNDVCIWNRALAAAEISQVCYLGQELYADVLNWQSWDVLIPMASALPGLLIQRPLVYRPRFEPAFFE